MVGKAYRMETAVGRYMEFAKASFPREMNLDGLKIVVDCANGAAYKVGPGVLAELGADVITINSNPNGLNTSVVVLCTLKKCEWKLLNLELI